MKIAIRVDASAQIGSGHLMRCLTLADAFRQNGASVIFVTGDLAGTWTSLIESKGHVCCLLDAVAEADASNEIKSDTSAWQLDAVGTMACLNTFGRPDLLIVDHYGLDEKWETCLRSATARILVIDDLANRKHDCDFLLDTNFFEAGDHRYDHLIPEACVRLLGPKYALLRQEFSAARKAQPAADALPFRILLSFGGSDASGETLKVLTAIAKSALHDIAIDVVVGSWNKQQAQIEQLCREIPGASYLFNVGNMADLMAAASLYVGAGGTTTWERCCMGLPGIVVATAQNQVSGSVAMAQSGTQIYLGDAADVTGGQVVEAISFLQGNAWIRDALGKASARVVDGAGVQRVTGRLSRMDIDLRPALPSDAEMLFRWRNAPEVRRNAFDSGPIEWPVHAAWHAAALVNPDRILLIAASGGEAIGVLRFDLEGDVGKVSIYLAPEHQGKGYGEHILNAGSVWMLTRYRHIKSLQAEILPENSASARIFERAGFDLKNLVFRRLQKHVH